MKLAKKLLNPLMTQKVILLIPLGLPQTPSIMESGSKRENLLKGLNEIFF